MITLDSSGILAALNKKDRHHRSVVNLLRRERGPLVLPAAILCEVTYFIERRGGHDALDRFLSDVQSGRFHLDCGDADMPRIRELVGRYANLPLGFADASVIACAERNGGRVCTLDMRDFGIVANEGRLTILPAPTN